MCIAPLGVLELERRVHNSCYPPPLSPTGGGPLPVCGGGGLHLPSGGFPDSQEGSGGGGVGPGWRRGQLVGGDSTLCPGRAGR